MPSLSELQSAMHKALVSDGGAGLAPSLVGDAGAAGRFAIHQRHYEASLVRALHDKFPGTLWLVGSGFMTDVASAFVRAHPPAQPCIAEYGERFPEFLARHPAAADLDYLGPFAELEWHAGQVSISVTRPELSWADVTSAGADELLGARLRLQPGVRYVRAPSAVDELLELHLSGSEPRAFSLARSPVAIEVRGARGVLHINRLDAGTFTFRSALLAGARVGDAAGRAIEVDESFDAGRGLAQAVTDGLVTEVRTDSEGTR